MSTPTTRRPNGKGKPIQCPNAPECVVAQQAADTLSLIDARLIQMETTLGEMMGHMSRMQSEALDSRKAIIESHEAVLQTLKRLRPQGVEGA